MGRELARSGAVAGTLHLVQALARALRGGISWPVLCIATRGAQDCGRQQWGAAATMPHQAAVLGLARVIESEIPELDCVCVDLDPVAATCEEEVAAVASEAYGSACGALWKRRRNGQGATGLHQAGYIVACE